METVERRQEQWIDMCYGSLSPHHGVFVILVHSQSVTLKMKLETFNDYGGPEL